MLSLNIEKRGPEKAYRLRREGKIPAVFYGRKQDSTPVALSQKDFLKVWKEAGESAVVVLKDGEEDIPSLIHGVEVHPVTEEVLHADFYAFEKGQKMKVNIPLEFEGEAPAVKTLGGVLVKVMHELEVEAEPKNLPHSLTVDISPLENFESQIFAKDIPLPAGVELITEPEEVVASVYEPKEETEESAPAEFDPNAIEVEKKGKEEVPAEGGDSGEKKKGE